MARTRNQPAYDNARTHLLDVGVRLIRKESFEGVGINDVLQEAGVPKGSFYHYFENKEAFGLDVARHYHDAQMSIALKTLGESAISPIDRLRGFFAAAYEDYESRGFGQGCLMCNLSTELSDESDAFQQLLQRQWNELSHPIGKCISDIDGELAGLGHLDSDEAGDWLLNAWSGALTRMKATRDGAPLKLFMKSVFGQGE